MTDQDIEFIPTDDLVEDDETGGADEAVETTEMPEEPRQRMTVEDEDFEAEELDEAEAEEVELAVEEEETEAETTEAAGEAEEAEALEEAEEEEHEADLEEILRRHAGLQEKPEETEAEEAEVAPGQAEVETAPVREFVCTGCFLRRPISQLADPTRGLCGDCAATS